MFKRLWPAPEAGVLPIERLHVPTVILMAIMTFAMIVVAAAGLALANAARQVASGVENRFVIELPATATEQMPGVVTAARSQPGVSGVTPVPQAEMRRTLERWLGEAASSADLPVPSLVTFEAEPGADLVALEMRLKSAAPDARLIAQTGELKPLLQSIATLKWLALALIALIAAAMAAAVVLAARGALDTHRSTIEIMHGIGATDGQVTRLFKRKIAVDAVAGAGAGAAAATAILLIVTGTGAALAGGFGAAAPLAGIDLAVLALMPLASVALAIGVAHRTLLAALRATL